MGSLERLGARTEDRRPKTEDRRPGPALRDGSGTGENWRRGNDPQEESTAEEGPPGITASHLVHESDVANLDSRWHAKRNTKSFAAQIFMF